MNVNNNSKRPYKKLVCIPLNQVKINDLFWNKRIETNNSITLNAIYEKMVEDHHIDNFRIAAGELEGIHQGFFYNDSDLYKWMEAACYSFYSNDNPELSGTIDGLIYLFEKAQLPNGYLNTYFTTNFPEKRWIDTTVMHELYCAGHLIQASITHYQATGKEKLLNIAKKFADLIIRVFIPGKLEEVPGHEEIELALIELYRITGSEKYLKMAQVFIDRRGTYSFFMKKFLLGRIETLKNTQQRAKNNKLYFKMHPSEEPRQNTDVDSTYSLWKGLDPDKILRAISQFATGKYFQNHKPVRQQNEAVGHAVRAVYLYCGMSELYSETGDKSLLIALEKIWDNMTNRRMYITGSIGSLPIVEAFGKDFELPNKTSYAETCAAIGSLMWNWRMLLITGSCKYADLIEKILYNGFLVGISLDGKRFSYRNVLESDGTHKREEWFETACCPPNIARTMASLGKYIYSMSDKGVWIHQYIGSKLGPMLFDGTNFELHQETDFPWQGIVKFQIKIAMPKQFSIIFRNPSWCKTLKIKINNEEFKHKTAPGNYLEVQHKWKNDDLIELEFLMTARLEKSHPGVKNNRGRVAIVNGPLIYCIEGIDNPDFNMQKDKIGTDYHLKVSYRPNLLGGVNAIIGRTFDTKKEFIAIPYFAWGNRGSSKMQVWNKINMAKFK